MHYKVFQESEEVVSHPDIVPVVLDNTITVGGELVQLYKAHQPRVQASMEVAPVSEDIPSSNTSVEPAQTTTSKVNKLDLF